MERVAIAVRRGPEDQKLFWSIERNAAGDLYCREAAPGKPTRRATSPRVTWRADGHWREVTSEGVTLKRRRPPLARLRECTDLLASPVLRALAHELPACDPTAYDRVLDLPLELLADGAVRYRQLRLMLGAGASVALEAEPNTHLIAHWELPEFRPLLSVALLEFDPDAA